MVKCICGNSKALYGYVWKCPLACSKCRDPGMTNVEMRRCEFPGCMKIPSYGDPKQRRKRFCKPHSKKNHVNLCYKKCIKYNCGEPAKYGFVELDKPYYCLKHSNIRMIDVTKRICRSFLCNNIAYYGDPDTREKNYCATHKLEHHVNLTLKNKIDNKET